ncbi:MULTISPECIES: restriction endonuclease [Priestia]|uniref:restriction endonuclease n=1 Tax=Priestia TaxID=2800373 RepID=UPI001C8D47A3|nr:restriction endonuclease [Priestia aryabhattai]MBY0213846.1 restriction endonuclease [Priestia aryabhattai]
MAKKVISSAAINAIKEALTNVYWYKKELRSFITYSINDPRILSRLDWSDYKRNIVSSLVDYLAENQERYKDDLLTIMSELIKIDDFSHLQKLEDGKDKAKAAKDSIKALKNLYNTHSSIVEEQKKIEARREKSREKLIRNKAINEKLDELKNEYYQLLSQASNPQSRGYKLEVFLKELFLLFDLDPKSSFKLTGEQIDGAFSFQNTEFLLEAKWHKEPTSIQHLDAFNGKIGRKLENTLGLFISINGFTPDAVLAHSSGRKSMILMDGMDIMAVLEQRMDLIDLLSIKKRVASQKGNIYLKINEILAH